MRLSDGINASGFSDGFVQGGVGLEAHRGEEAGFQRIGCGLEQLWRELVAFPVLKTVVLEHGLPAQCAQNEAPIRLTVIAVECLLAATQQPLGVQKVFVKSVARCIDEIQPGGLALPVNGKQHMGHGAAGVDRVIGACQAVKICAAGQGAEAGGGHAVAAGIDRAACARVIGRGLAQQLRLGGGCAGCQQGEGE